MANPFEVTPANPLQIAMLGQQGYEQGKKLSVENNRQVALSQLGGLGGAPNYAGVANKLAAAGDLAGATQIAGLAKNLAGPESTDEIKEYNLSKQQGYTGSFTDWKTALKVAGATKINNSVSTGENEYAKKIAAGDAARFQELQKSGQNANGAIGTLNLMDNITRDPNFYSGSNAGLVTRGKQALAGLGITAPDSAGPNELFDSLSNKMVLDASGGSLGAGVSNADVGFITNTVPALGKTPEGNRQLIDISRKVYQRKQEEAKMAREYAAKNGGRLDSGFDDKLAEYAAKNPLFPQRPAASGNLTGTGVKWKILD